MTNEKQQNRKTFIDCYRIGRSLEYMDRYDQEQAWKKLNSAIQRKRLHRRISYMSSVAAMVAIAFTSFYLWRGEDQAPAEKLADSLLRPLLGNNATIIFAVALLFAGIASTITSGMAAGSIFLPGKVRSGQEKRW